MKIEGLVANKAFEVPTTISETIYKYLKNAIIEGEFKPNQRLQEKEIAELFRVSTTPIREAFQRLSAEKYIIISTHKEVIVASATLEKIKELFEVVRVLDAFATKKSLKNLTDNDITELKKMTEKLDNFYKQKKIQAYVKENLRIHDKLWKSCGNKFLYESLVNLSEKYTFYANQGFFLTAKSTDNTSFLNKSHKDHIDLMKAIEKKDGYRVEKLLLSHWGRGFLGKEDPDSNRKQFGTNKKI